jgi:L-lysine exporter family protein LysE/ArgO
MASIFLEGLVLQASLIFALGAQNIFVLESGLRRRHPVAVSFACFFCDFVIIMLGVMGAATIFNGFPQLKIMVGVLGIGFLFYYGWTKLRTSEEELTLKDKMFQGKGLKWCVLSAITFSVVNPHAYLDGIVLIGGYSSKYIAIEQRFALGMGAAIYSLVWFLFLSFASSFLMPVFKDARRMRILMSTSGMVLIVLSVKLGLDVYSWFQEIFDPNASLALQE